MCGIFLALDRETYQSPSTQIQSLLKQRGPDSQRQIHFSIEPKSQEAASRQDSPLTPRYQGDFPTANTSVHLSCLGSVLSLRGNQITKQPVSSSGKSDTSLSSFLCWNGEAWTFASTPIRGSDSAHVLDLLSYVCATSRNAGDETPELAISEALSAYAGPYAFAYYDHLYRRIYCGRDFLGRRSLLSRRTHTGLVFSSTPDDEEGWAEVEADGVYWVDLDVGSDLNLRKSAYRCTSDGGRSSRSTSPCELELQRKPIADLDVHHAANGTIDPVDCLHHLLHDALQSRLCTIPEMVPAHPPQLNTRLAKVAVLFSGGIDCTMLARLAHDIIDLNEPIDLLNVAFENPRVHRQHKVAGESPYEQCPDRKTALTSLKELQTSCPGRNWNLVKVNVPYTEFRKHRPKVISLIRPHNTEMDLSIATALYFAARGIGLLEDDSLYETSARVLLSGLGADELFAGYTRHATAYSRGGLNALEDELALDISRLGKRNLGRDDRVISHWAKEARYPFLDESLVKWALSATLYEKCGFGIAPLPVDDHGAPLDPAKMIIRSLAVKLDMPGVAQEKKRAIQFGARTAKMEVRKTKGTQALTAMAA
ncbi:hypothetical protein B9Z65_2502 [Elsinoe australis]|uniref:Asparagine synthetase domain-containing protein n=1 Tax=Elsinoe australis TaxID=40998 RepID=A0A2P7ZAX0_9PEZI|nr:hypothetical protein B9Z65_2502 [Elsinoe australis]